MLTEINVIANYNKIRGPPENFPHVIGFGRGISGVQELVVLLGRVLVVFPGRNAAEHGPQSVDHVAEQLHDQVGASGGRGLLLWRTPSGRPETQRVPQGCRCHRSPTQSAGHRVCR